MNTKVDFFFTNAKSWKSEYELLREIVLESGLDEVLKWGCPTYTPDDKNVLLIHGFKDYCALLFMKGALLKDPKGILIQQTKNVQAARQMRFTSAKEIKSLKNNITAEVTENKIAITKSDRNGGDSDEEGNELIDSSLLYFELSLNTDGTWTTTEIKK